jgi:uncharacterized membrane protein HdeD (DUF308 family)
MTPLYSVLMGAVAMASLVAMLFFIRFWRQTGDALFILFALAFGLDAVMRVALGLATVSSETEPLIYISRLVSFALIVAAIVRKNWRGKN